MDLFNFDISKYENVSGTLELKLPTFEETLEISEKLNYIQDGEGAYTVETPNAFRRGLNLIKATKSYFKKIDLEVNGDSVKTHEGMNKNKALHSLLADASHFIAKGGELGN